MGFCLEDAMCRCARCTTFLCDAWLFFDARGNQLIPPFSIGDVKGWKRAVMALVCLHGVKEMQLTEQVDHMVKASLFA